MPHSCSAYNCTNRWNKTINVSYYKFPLRDKELTKKWVNNMKRKDWYPTESSYLCSEHFENKFMYYTNDQRRLLANAIPTVFSFPRHLQKKVFYRAPPKKRDFHEMIPNEIPDPVSLPGRNGGNPLSDHKYSLPSPKKMKMAYDKIADVNSSLKKKVKLMQQTVMRRKQKISSYEKLITGLNKRLQVSTTELLLTSQFSETLKELMKLQSKGPVHQYPNHVKKFALTLNFYSAQAYRYVRKFVRLPHPRTLREWATAVGGNPGFTEESFQKIASEVRASDELILGTLMFDEMAIKKELIWDGNNVTGYVDLGQGGDENEGDVAKEALVFMVTALNKSWKIPVGYCLINSLPASVKCNILTQYLRKLETTGMQVVAVVCDGTATNRSVFEKLGVRLSSDNPQCWFPHPSNNERKVFCVFDTAHMLKLVRNLLGEKKIILDGTASIGQNLVKWEYLSKLVSLQEKEGLHAANKLRKQHIQFQSQKMKVALAAQTLSNSVANAIMFCRDLGLEEFSGCESTVKFLKLINIVFDLLNSCHPMSKGTKSAISKGNMNTVKKHIKECINYLKNLKLSDGTPVHKSARRMGITGFILTLLSVQELASLYVWQENSVLKFMLTRRMSQDHLELFFSSIRSRGGNRNNPNAVQFRAAYRKCLIAQIEPSSQCTNSNSSGIELLIPDTIDSVRSVDSTTQFDLDHDYVHSYQSLTLFTESVVDYMAGSVVRQVSKKLKCISCFECLFAHKRLEKVGLIKLKDVKDCLINPSVDIVKLLKVAEKVFRLNEQLLTKSSQKVLLKLQTDVFHMLPNNLFVNHDHLFTSTEVGVEPHYVSLIKLLLKQYFTCRLHHICESKSLAMRGQQIRQKFTKLILFKGQ